MTDLYIQVISKIIAEQKAIIGPLASDLAHKIPTIHFDSTDSVDGVAGDAKDTITKLVMVYSQLFGKASEEVCKDAVRQLTLQAPQDSLPEILR